MSKEQAIRELVEAFDEAAQVWGWERDWGYGTGVDDAEESHASARAALLAAIDRLERKAATAKAECDAWGKAFDDADIEPAFVHVVGSDSTYVPESVQEAVKRIDAARAATDASWREPENKEDQQ